MRNLCLVVALGLALVSKPSRATGKTVVGIDGQEFLVNGRPAYQGRSYDGMKVQGLLFNPRMVQGIFDDQNSAFQTNGVLRPDYMSRLERILDRADELGMVAIVGFFYQAQERRMDDEQSVIRAADAAMDWLVAKGYRHLLVEVANEADNAGFKYDIVRPTGGAVLRASVQGDGRRLTLKEERSHPQAL